MDLKQFISESSRNNRRYSSILMSLSKEKQDLPPVKIKLGDTVRLAMMKKGHEGSVKVSLSKTLDKKEQDDIVAGTKEGVVDSLECMADTEEKVDVQCSEDGASESSNSMGNEIISVDEAASDEGIAVEYISNVVVEEVDKSVDESNSDEISNSGETSSEAVDKEVSESINIGIDDKKDSDSSDLDKGSYSDSYTDAEDFLNQHGLTEEEKEEYRGITDWSVGQIRSKAKEYEYKIMHGLIQIEDSVKLKIENMLFDALYLAILKTGRVCADFQESKDVVESDIKDSCSKEDEKVSEVGDKAEQEEYYSPGVTVNKYVAALEDAKIISDDVARLSSNIISDVNIIVGALTEELDESKAGMVEIIDEVKEKENFDSYPLAPLGGVVVSSLPIKMYEGQLEVEEGADIEKSEGDRGIKLTKRPAKADSVVNAIDYNGTKVPAGYGIMPVYEVVDEKNPGVPEYVYKCRGMACDSSSAPEWKRIETVKRTLCYDKREPIDALLYTSAYTTVWTDPQSKQIRRGKWWLSEEDAKRECNNHKGEHCELHKATVNFDYYEALHLPIISCVRRNYHKNKLYVDMILHPEMDGMRHKVQAVYPDKEWTDIDEGLAEITSIVTSGAGYAFVRGRMVGSDKAISLYDFVDSCDNSAIGLVWVDNFDEKTMTGDIWFRRTYSNAVFKVIQVDYETANMIRHQDGIYGSENYMVKSEFGNGMDRFKNLWAIKCNDSKSIPSSAHTVKLDTLKLWVAMGRKVRLSQVLEDFDTSNVIDVVTRVRVDDLLAAESSTEVPDGVNKVVARAIKDGILIVKYIKYDEWQPERHFAVVIVHDKLCMLYKYTHEDILALSEEVSEINCNFDEWVADLLDDNLIPADRRVRTMICG